MKLILANSRLYILISSLLIFSACNKRLANTGQTGIKKSEKGKTYDIYALMGQSNMAGRGEIDSLSNTYKSKNVLVLTASGELKIAEHPLHFDKSIAAVGPGLMFGHELSKFTENKIILVPCAVGGSSIKLWQPGMFDGATNTHPYDDAISRLEKVLESGGEIKGVIWHQGESDRAKYTKERYLSELTILINRLRKFTGNPNLPFVVGELGYFIDGADKFNEWIKDLSNLVDYTAVVSAEGLQHKGDNLHFDARSAERLGVRYAEAMKSIEPKIE
ncbi:MAG: acetylxylan esterase [Thalassobius sp.]|nr:acetylxylan esterase [Thalassovita sp.]